jgi:hypothetical protein
MKTTNKLIYIISKKYVNSGITFKIKVKISLDDYCKNNIRVNRANMGKPI